MKLTISKIHEPLVDNDHEWIARVELYDDTNQTKYDGELMLSEANRTFTMNVYSEDVWILNIISDPLSFYDWNNFKKKYTE
jgi:hypothetical protein